MIHKLSSATVATCYDGLKTEANYSCSFLSGLNLNMYIFVYIHRIYMYMTSGRPGILELRLDHQ